MLTDFDLIALNCIWGKAQNIVAEIKALCEDDEYESWTFERVPLDIRSICFPAPPRGGLHAPRFAIWQPRNVAFGSVLVPNYEDGMIQMLRYLNRHFQRRYFQGILAKDHEKTGYCAFTHVSETGAKRVVHVIREARWQFFAEGATLPFEDVTRYERRRIAERLTPRTVVAYLKSLGWNLEEPDFWKADGDAWLGNGVFRK